MPAPPPHGGGDDKPSEQQQQQQQHQLHGQVSPTATAAAAAPPPPPTAVLTLLPSRRVKTLHLVRHAEGFHNVAGAADYANYKLERFLDAHLTSEGWRQAHALRDSIRRAAVRPQVVLTSPLARALETAAAAFGGPVLPFEEEGQDEGRQQQQPLLMRGVRHAEPGVREAHPPIATAGAPPFAAVEEAREHLGVHPCDRRRPLSGKRRAFPAVDWDAHALAEEDELWEADRRETEAEIKGRAMALLRLIAAGRAEGELAVVSHSSLLRHMLAAAAAAADEDVRRPFANAEMRTVVLVVSP